VRKDPAALVNPARKKRKTADPGDAPGSAFLRRGKQGVENGGAPGYNRSGPVGSGRKEGRKAVKQSSLRKNFILNALLTLSSFLFPLITFPYVSRVLQPENYGRVNFAASFVAYFNMLAQLGVPTYGIRAAAAARGDRDGLSRTAQELLRLNLLMSALAYLALTLCLLFIPRVGQDWPLLLVFSLTILLNSIGMEWLYQGLEQYAYITVRSVVFKAVALAATFLFVRSEGDYLIYAAVAIFASSASNLLNFFHARRYITLRPLRGCDIRRHLRPAAVFFAMACATTIYASLDEVMLGFMTSNTDVGYYHAAVKVKTILVGIVTALGAVLLPRATYYVEHGLLDEFRRITGRALHFVLLAAAPLSLYFLLFAREGILLLSGSAYANAVLPMQILMPTLLLIGVTNVLGIQILVPTGREKTVLVSEIAGAAVDLVLNALLIPRYAATGAAIGTLAAEAVVLAVQLHALRGELRSAVSGLRPSLLLAALVPACAASLWVKLLGLGSFPALLISAVCFFGVYAAVLLLGGEKLARELWKELLARRKRS